jgi:hypothetical protein
MWLFMGLSSFLAVIIIIMAISGVLYNFFAKTGETKKWVAGFFLSLILFAFAMAKDTTLRNSLQKSVTPNQSQVKIVRGTVAEGPFVLGPYDYRVDVDGVGKIKGGFIGDIGIGIARIEDKKILQNKEAHASVQAKGTFKVLYLALTNMTKDTIPLKSNSFVLLDEKGNEYPYSIEAQIVMDMGQSEAFLNKKLTPGLTTGGYLVFDVPPAVKKLFIRVNVGFTEENLYLPLTVKDAE